MATFVDEIRKEYTRKVTFEDVINEIKHHVSFTYDILKVKGFSSSIWVGFDAYLKDSIPDMDWKIDKFGTHTLFIPASSGIDIQDVLSWFERQGFDYTENESGFMAWWIKF